MKQVSKRPAVFMIEDIETLKMLTDPLRIQILELLSLEPHTVKYVGDRLGLSTNRLYYHFNLLESKGIISVVDTKTINNIIEKYYWNSADDYEINSELLNFSDGTDMEDIHRIISATLDATHDDFMRSIQAKQLNALNGGNEDPQVAVAYRVKKRVKKEVFSEFMGKVKALIDEFQSLPQEDDDSPDANVFSLSLFLYPSFYYEDDLTDENKQFK